MEIKVSSSNSISFDNRSLATPSKISSDLSRPAPTAANQQQSNTYNGSPDYPKYKIPLQFSANENSFFIIERGG